MMTPFRRAAKATASADLPLAVGPARMMSFCSSLAEPALPVLPAFPMSHIVTLVAACQAGPLTDSLANIAREYCEGQKVHWLAPGEACEFMVKRPPDIARVKLVLGDKPVDQTMGLFLKGENSDRELTEARRLWDFQVQSEPSRSDPSGRILRIERLRRVR